MVIKYWLEREGFLPEADSGRCVVPGLGLEPRLAEPESAVLPLDDPGMLFDSRLKRNNFQVKPRTFAKVRGKLSQLRFQVSSDRNQAADGAKGYSHEKLDQKNQPKIVHEI